ncbi:hypothetical protein BCR36DRAFT_397929 [Piromyces finnis]|uniref:Uncharacterized protein n=1 Tax=Piromyces finnis TaxID=1754191 RepID=A0A1Y1V7Y9_9FUNG|nr:hypothetical protein BCR36DRAFT_397929 [Piromyces finnis]|eukprot:ORX49349.1 hypothetical protein BCR36DRAFT_397929 [Piromyces finnis]
MHEKLKVNIQKNGVENLNTNNNIKNLEIIKAYKNGELKNIKVNKNEVAIPSKNINFKTSINDKNYNINNNQYKNEKINTHNQNENSNYQLMKENKNNYEYSYSKIHTYHPVPYPHSSIIKNDIDNHHHHHHHHHHHQYRHNHHSNGMKRINEKHKKTIDFIDNLNAQFKFNIEPTTEKAPQKVKANMREDIQSNDKSNDTLENKDLNEKYQNDNIQKQQHHHHYHPYTYQCDYLNYSISDLNTKENRQKNKDIFDLSDIKEILEAQSNKLFKKNISFSIENEELRCPSNKPYHLKQRMENRQRKNNKNYEILANTNELMLEKDLNEREIQFYCLRVMEQKAQQKHSEIIKQRKEKMSNHNQHINNVRRQNILDRSKWRCERSQKMNCRQLKVEQNRRKIINGKKALYASFVDKAKNVVMDLKKRENMLKLKRLEDLNEKMNESEKRRQILMTTSKSKILDVSFSLYQQQQIEKIAALDIQRWWRKKYFGSILNKFIDLDISSDIAKSLSFEKLHEKLHSSEAMEISKDLLYRIFKSSPKKNSIDNKKQENDNSSEKDNNDNLSTKISNTNTKESSNKKTQINIKHYSEEKMFLSAFMIYGHSKTVISSIGDVEKVKKNMFLL